MKQKYDSTPPEKVDSASLRLHRRQFNLQILLPILLMVILIVIVGGSCVIIFAAKGDAASQWADTSLVFMIMPALIFALAGTALIAVFIYLMAKLLNILPVYTNRVQGFFANMAAWTRKIADMLVKPVFAVHSSLAGAKRFNRHLAGKK